MKAKFAAILIPAVLMCIQTGCGRISVHDSDSIVISTSYEKKTYTSEDIYNEMSAALMQFENTTVYENILDDDAVTEAVKMVKQGHPDIFWLDGYAITETGSTTEISFMTLDGYSGQELSEMYGRLIEAADNIISTVPAGYSEYEKALFVHDHIVRNTVYAHENAGSGVNGLWGTAYGCLINGSAVCQGYAEAYQLILSRMGIECGVCTGDSSRGRHAWNYVRIDGAYYWVDVTWDDPESETGSDEKLRHTYFLINDELLMRSRTFDSGQLFVPVCSSMNDNYFVRSNAYLNNYSPEEIAAVMAGNAGSREAEIMFSNETAYKAAVQSLFDNQEIWSLSEYVWLNEYVSYSSDDLMYVLDIQF